MKNRGYRRYAGKFYSLAGCALVCQRYAAARTCADSTRSGRNVKGALAATVAVFALAGCGADHRAATGDGLPIFNPRNIPPPAPVNPVLFPKVFTPEFFGSYALGTINAGNAYVAGLTGRGVTVAIVDSGIAAIAKLQGQIAETVNVTSAPLIEDDHGTSIAAILAARSDGTYIHGVAYGAHVADIKAGNENNFQLADLQTALMVSAGQNKSFGTVNASIVNLSLGGDTPISAPLRSALDAVVDAGKIIVIAAGNNTGPLVAGANPSTLSLFATDPDAKGQVIIAGASTQAGTIARFSNRAGGGKAFYLLAPGDRIPTLSASGAQITQSGTSFSAPIISGAAALLEQEFPNLKAAKIVQILLTTADPLPSGTSADFGAGLLDLAKAIQPIGPMTVPTGRTAAGPAIALGPARLSGGGAFGTGIPAGLSGLHILALDSFQRGYLVGLPVALHGAQDRPGFAYDLIGQAPVLSAATSMLDTSRPHGSMGFAYSPASDRRTAGFDAAVSLGGGTVAEIGQHVSAMTLAAASLPDTQAADDAGQPLFLGGDLSVLPQASLLPDGYGFAVSHRFATFRATASALASDGAFDPYTGRFEAGANRLAQLSVGTTIAGIEIGLGLGELKETGRRLGSVSTGALSLGSGGLSTFGTLTMAAKLTDALEVTAAYTAGWTAAQGPGNGLFSGVSRIESDSFAVGLVEHDSFSKGDALGLQVAQPLRVARADAELSLPVALDADGNVLRATSRIDLAPRGREIDIQVAYRASLAAMTGDIVTTGQIQTFVMARLNPAHDASAPPDYAAGLRFNFSF